VNIPQDAVPPLPHGVFAQTGIAPRPAPTDYPVYQTAGGITVAARALGPDQVRKVLPPDVNRAGFLVFEVALYPEAGKSINLSSDDFLLRVGPNSETLASVTGADVAATLAKHGSTPQRQKDVTVVATTDVGYESVNNPATAQRGHAVYTGAGVGVGVGNPGPPFPDLGAADRYRDAIQQALDTKSLPEGPINVPVAGYLYFPKSHGKATAPYFELDYYGAADQIKVRLP
jgi:hypothetical protein